MMSTNSQELLELAVLAALNAFAWSHHAQVHLALIPVPAPLKLVKRVKGTTKQAFERSSEDGPLQTYWATGDLSQSSPEVPP
ncbi:hypothetical protein AALO_G00203240 [Alosa alosa]|uniref:Secreted protein n=1 Tax=Alosa alosa TaxID=278164 RepID=A0AAV6GA02_9TELE|nr:hypothetical protein AALO_G00203240 [Alosa alosa]